MPTYPALHAYLSPEKSGVGALRAGYAIGGGIAQRQERTRLAGLRGEAVAGMMGGGQPGYLGGEGPSPEAAGMGFGAAQQPQGAQGPLGQRPGAGGDKRAFYKYLAEDPKGAAELYDLVNAMDDRQRAQGEREAGMTGRLGAWVLGAETPLELESRYQQARQIAQQNGVNTSNWSPNADRDEIGAQVGLVTKIGDAYRRAAEARKAAAAESRFGRREKGLDRRARIAAGKKTEREKKIADLKTRGFSDTEAQDLASGRWRLAVNPVTGSKSLVNVATGEERPVGVQTDLPKKTQAEIATQNRAIRSVMPLIDDAMSTLDKAVGLVPAAKELYGRTAGQIPEGRLGPIPTGEAAVDQEVIQARQKIRILREELIKAFRKQGRVPVTEQKRLLALIPGDGIFESEPVGRANLQEIKNFLSSVLSQNTGSSNASSSPEVGAVEDGYIFQGGDPADPGNWDKIE